VIKVLPYRHGDVDPQRAYAGWDEVASLVAHVQPEKAVSLYHQDPYLASAGIIEISPGVGEVWLVVNRLPPSSVGFIKTLRHLLLCGVQHFGFQRLRSFVLAEDRRAKKFAQLFVFQIKYQVDAMEQVVR